MQTRNHAPHSRAFLLVGAVFLVIGLFLVSQSVIPHSGPTIAFAQGEGNGGGQGNGNGSENGHGNANGQASGNGSDNGHGNGNANANANANGQSNSNGTDNVRGNGTAIGVAGGLNASGGNGNGQGSSGGNAFGNANGNGVGLGVAAGAGGSENANGIGGGLKVGASAGAGVNAGLGGENGCRQNCAPLAIDCVQGSPGCPNPMVTNCNANNPNGGGCPQSANVCSHGEHVGNPHCISGTTTTSAPAGACDSADSFCAFCQRHSDAGNCQTVTVAGIQPTPITIGATGLTTAATQPLPAVVTATAPEIATETLAASAPSSVSAPSSMIEVPSATVTTVAAPAIGVAEIAAQPVLAETAAPEQIVGSVEYAPGLETGAIPFSSVLGVSALNGPSGGPASTALGSQATNQAQVLAAAPQLPSAGTGGLLDGGTPPFVANAWLPVAALIMLTAGLAAVRFVARP